MSDNSLIPAMDSNDVLRKSLHRVQLTLVRFSLHCKLRIPLLSCRSGSSRRTASKLSNRSKPSATNWGACCPGRAAPGLHAVNKRNNLPHVSGCISLVLCWLNTQKTQHLCCFVCESEREHPQSTAPFCPPFLASPTLRFGLGMGKQRIEPKTAWKTGQKEATWHLGTSSRAQSPHQSE